jgi:chaperonin GroEL (HSP60 family)
MFCDGISDENVQAKHANGEHSWGVNGETGKIADMKEYGLYESASVKIQTLKTSIEVMFLVFFFLTEANSSKSGCPYAATC